MASEVLRSSGSLRLQVTGWSMLPTVWPGDILVIEHLESDAAKDGDIVLFGRDRRLFAHRIISQDSKAGEPGILTRGDAMAAPDAPVAKNELLGKVSYILRNGKCIEPNKTLRFPERAVAALVQRSETAARLVMGVHGLHQASRVRTSQD
ncbi:MAG TPA: S24/S26 family peptidase [Candidatus Dormibacteraeota bacterium]|nr:S24/S26 family peptidase [Candidatus Dormibacteraeota bacterium]